MPQMQKIADLMDDVCLEDKKPWSDHLKNQKKVLENLDYSLSGTLLREIQNRNISYQEYGKELSSVHKAQMNELSLNCENDFKAIAKESLLEAEKIEKDSQVDFEVYLKDFLDKIS